MRLVKLLLVLFMCAAGPAVAGPFEDGQAAFDNGDYETAFRVWHPLAKNGHAGAQLGLGTMYGGGLGVPPNDTAAVLWIKMAAEKGDAAAQLVLSGIYEDGRYGVPRDLQAAMSWIRKAAEQGNLFAQYRLGDVYLYSFMRVPKDSAMAASWYRKAAEQGLRNAQYELGLLYLNGEGVPQDYALGHMWFNLAAAQGDTYAAQLRDSIAAKMTPRQIAEAQRLAREWSQSRQSK